MRNEEQNDPGRMLTLLFAVATGSTPGPLSHPFVEKRRSPSAVSQRHTINQ